MRINVDNSGELGRRTPPATATQHRWAAAQPAAFLARDGGCRGPGGMHGHPGGAGRLAPPVGLEVPSVPCGCRPLCGFRRRAVLVQCAAPSKVPVLLVGSGGREHALSWKLAQSPLCDTLYCAPGNAGIAAEPGVETVPNLDIDQHDEVVAWCKEKDIGLVTVGPEAPLVAGLVDALRAGGIRVFGPTASAARLEGSKSFLKELCRDFGIPTAAFQRFSDAAAAKAYIQDLGAPIVVKADGLAAGKGVVVAHNVEEAFAAVDDMLLRGKFGAAGAEIVVEEFLEGEEASFFALVDGTICVPLASAQDHKAVWEGDRGPNTGGMGAYSPAPAVTPAVEAQVMAEIVQRTADAMAQQGAPFHGILFAGLMIQGDRAKLLEHNIRFGDPECQALMARLDSDLLPLLLAVADGRLAAAQSPVWSPNAALTVVLASRGYPGPYASGSIVRGLNAVRGAKVFHAGTALNAGGEVIATGGRVLGVTATGATVAAAQRAAYQAVDVINWPEGFCRRDIGWRAA